MEENQIIVFLAEFDHQVEQIEKIYDRLEKKLVRLENDAAADETVESAGYWIHNLYCAFEDLFESVAGFWENNVPSDGGFHINLLKRMVIRIDKIRPALLSDESYTHLNELRGFRHVFRYAYSHSLDKDRVHNLLLKTAAKKSIVLNDAKVFRDTVAATVNGADSQ